MNCPNCGRPLSETSNICPRCKTHIQRDAEHSYNENPRGAAVTDEKPLSKHGFKKFLRVLLAILILVIIAGVLAIIFRDEVIPFAQKHEWLNWLAKFLGMFN